MQQEEFSADDGMFSKVNGVYRYKKYKMFLELIFARLKNLISQEKF